MNDIDARATPRVPRRVAMSGTGSGVLGAMGLIASASGFFAFFGLVLGSAGLLLGGICAWWGRRSTGSAQPSVPGLLLSALAVAIALGWMMYMAVDPATASLEIVVGSTLEPAQPCVLNRSSVTAGEHEVSVISERASGAVVIRDGAGGTVFAGDEGQDVIALSEGDYVIECTVDGTTVGEAPLHVAAR